MVESISSMFKELHTSSEAKLASLDMIVISLQQSRVKILWWRDFIRFDMICHHSHYELVQTDTSLKLNLTVESISSMFKGLHTSSEAILASLDMIVISLQQSRVNIRLWQVWYDLPSQPLWTLSLSCTVLQQLYGGKFYVKLGGRWPADEEFMKYRQFQI